MTFFSRWLTFLAITCVDKNVWEYMHIQHKWGKWSEVEYLDLFQILIEHHRVVLLHSLINPQDVNLLYWGKAQRHHKQKAWYKCKAKQQFYLFWNIVWFLNAVVTKLFLGSIAKCRLPQTSVLITFAFCLIALQQGWSVRSKYSELGGITT